MTQFIKVTQVADPDTRNPCEPEITFINAKYVHHFRSSQDNEENPTTDLYVEFLMNNRKPNLYIVRETPEEILAQLRYNKN